jgi:hypothetical protein
MKRDIAQILVGMLVLYGLLALALGTGARGRIFAVILFYCVFYHAVRATVRWWRWRKKRPLP